MKKRILLSVVWAVALPVIYMVASMLMFAVLGLLGFGKSQLPDKLTAGWYAFGAVAGVWAWLFWGSPIIGFLLAYFRILPGARQKRTEQTV